MSTRLILITGAPESRSLDWEHGLLDTFSEPFLRFAGLSVPQDSAQDTPALTSTSEYPAWRSIPLERQHLATGHSQDHGWKKQFQGALFLNTTDVNSFVEELSQPTGQSQTSSAESVEQVLSQYYEQSYAIHEDVVSSQIAGVSDGGTSLNSFETSFATTHASFESPMQSFSGRDIPTAGSLTALKDIPNASYLNSIYPQTMTINLIIGIISVPAPRAIKTRRGANVELVEVLVGDETKSGFGINFWLSSSPPVQGDMRSVLSGLRPQDVVMMRNVALSSFRGKVYGQSLRKEMTKVHLFYRNRIDRTDGGGYYHAADLVPGESLNPQVDKTRRVREWVLRFVGAGTGQKKAKGQVSELVREVLPPDTQ